MAKTPKYTGVTPNEDGSWSYRLKVKLPDGKMFDTRIKKDQDGKAFLRARDAYEAKKAHAERLKNPPAEEPTGKKSPLLSEIYESYLATEGKDKAPATLRKQESMWRNHIEPIFGDREIDSINLVELQDFLYELYQTHAYKYTEGFLKFFYLLFGHADRMDAIDPEQYNKMFVNKNKRLHMPKKSQADEAEDKEPAVIFDDSELRIIAKIFESEDGNLETAFYLGLYAGLRISECFGLRWRDIDWATKTMRISRQMHYIDGELRLCPVKTVTSDRTIIIPKELYEQLEFQYSVEAHYRKQMGNAYRNTERVYDEVAKEWLQGTDFVNRKKNGELLTVNSMKYWAKKITPALRAHAEQLADIKRMGHPDDFVAVKYKEFKYHYLRHTYASHCAAVNMSMHMLMSMMGHKKIDTTRKYYINTDNESLHERTRMLLNEMYTFRGLKGLGISVEHEDE